MAKRLNMDGWLLVTTGLLVVAGLFMVGSASHYVAMSQGVHPYHYLLRQLVYALLGSMGMAAVLSMPYDALKSRGGILTLLALSVVSLVLVLAMPPVGGARRWFPLGPFSVQPSEFAKVVAILFMARVLSRHEDRVNDLWRVPVPCLAAVGTLAFLVCIEPDLGSAVMLSLAAFVMIFVAGLRWRYVAAVSALGAIAVAVVICSRPYVVERIRSFLDPGSDVYGASFQLTQSLIAVGSGGVFGAGPGQGQQKAYFLPAPHTDFVFSVIGEEFGLVGTGFVLAAFMLVFWRGLRTALRAPDRFVFYLALGLTSLIVLQGLVNMGVCLGVLPTKGLPLPLLSYGGSSLLATMIALGLLLNVSQHAD